MVSVSVQGMCQLWERVGLYAEEFPNSNIGLWLMMLIEARNRPVALSRLPADID